MVGSRLLLVDDEPALLDLLKRYLERIGYTVDACSGAEAALREFASDPTRYALVLTDLTLEGISGEEMLTRMREMNPSLPAIVASGYPYQPQSAATVFLQKPFIPKVLAQAIGRILGA